MNMNIITIMITNVNADMTIIMNTIMTMNVVDMIITNMIMNMDVADMTNVGVTALDDTTFQVTLSTPCPYFERIFSGNVTSPMRPDFALEHDSSWSVNGTYPSSGPMVLESISPEEEAVLVKNENYWDAENVTLEKATFVVMTDSTAQVNAFRTGDIDIAMSVPSEVATNAEYESNIVMPEKYVSNYFVLINSGPKAQVEALKDENVRKALALAIDRDYVANTIMQGTYSAASNLVGPSIVDAQGYFYDNANGGSPYIAADYEANMAEAKKLLEEAGYPNGEGYPTIEYSTNDSGYHVPLAEYLQQAWGDLGITLTINKMEWSSFTPARRAGEYDVARNGWVMDYNDPSNMLELFTTGNGNNDGKYSNPDFDAAIDASRVADSAEHFAQLHKAEDILMEDMGCLPIAYYNDYWLQSSSLKGTWHSPYGYWYLQYGYIEG